MQPFTKPLSRQAAFIFNPSDSRLAVALRRMLGDYPAVEVPSWKACLDELRVRPGSAVGVAIDASDVDHALECVRSINSTDQRAAAIALAENSAAEVRAVLYECGCRFVCGSASDLPKAAKLIKRQLSSQASRGATLVEELWQRLPWQETT